MRNQRKRQRNAEEHLWTRWLKADTVCKEAKTKYYNLKIQKRQMQLQDRQEHRRQQEILLAQPENQSHGSGSQNSELS